MTNHLDSPTNGDLGKRFLRIGSARNLRDVGGYPTAGGRATAWRRLLRSDSLHNLSPADQRKLAGYGVRTVIDLRSIREAERAASLLVESVDLRYLHVPFGETPFVAAAATELYRMALHCRSRELQSVFALLAQDGVLPAVVQCSAGRDRTGLVVALVLACIGVPEEIIAEDYALSGARASVTHEPVSAESMLETLSYVKRTWGGVREYLLTIGVTDRELSSIRMALVQ